MTLEHVEELAFQTGARQHAIHQIGSIERSDELDRILQPELHDDVAAYPRGRGRGVGVQADVLKLRAEVPELAILRPEIVAPLADAVRLVHGDETDAALREQRQERLAALAGQPLRRDVEQPKSTRAQTSGNVGLLIRDRACC